METLRLLWRSAADTLEHLVPFVLATLAWWLCLLLILPAPAATVALTALTDPRRGTERPSWREALALARGGFRRGWGVALLTVPVVAVLLANLAYYGARASRWGVLIPLWSLLLLLAVAVALQAFAVAGLTAVGPATAVKRAALLTLLRPGRSLLLVGFGLLAVAVGGALVVPLVMIVPALVAAASDRFVLAGLGLTVPDPLAPTDERRVEQDRGRDLGRLPSRFGRR